MAAELAPDDPSAVTVIATGGLAALVIDEVPIIDAHEPWLTLIGLRLVWERNVSAGGAAAGAAVPARARAVRKPAVRKPMCPRARSPVTFGRD